MALLLSPEELERWRSLYASSERATPFQSPEWLEHLFNRHAAGVPRPLFTEHGFAPIVVERKGFSSVLRLAGGDYEDILCAPGDEAVAVREILEAIERERGWVVANFRALREDSALLVGFEAVAERIAAARVMPHRAHKYVKLPTTWAEYEKHIGKKLSYKLRAAAGRREKLFASCELRRATPETLDTDLDGLFEVHESRWVARGQRGVFAGEADRELFRKASAELLKSSRLWLYTLWFDGKAASALYCLVDRHAVYYYIGGIDAAHQKHHPGKVLIAQAIKDAIDSGLKEFDFLGGNEAYKSDWANAERHLCRLVIGRGVLGWIVVRGFEPVGSWLRARKAKRELKKAEGWTKPGPEPGND